MTVRPAHVVAAVAALVVTASAVGAALTFPAPAGWAVGPGPAKRVFSARLDADHLGRQVAVLVRGPGGARWFGDHAQASVAGGSTSKLATATAALLALGPDHELSTQVWSLPGSGRLSLVGGGDGLLTRSDVDRLAAQTVGALTASGQREVSVAVDDARFGRPVPAPGWPSGSVPLEASAVVPLGFVGPHATHPSMQVGHYFANRLTLGGITVTTVRQGVRPAGSTLLTAIPGHRVDAVVRHLLTVSDTDAVERLARLVAAQTGHRPTWNGVRHAIPEVLAQAGLPMRGVVIRDGSGLSRLDRVTPRFLVSLLQLAQGPTTTDLSLALVSGLPVAGLTGTLGPGTGRYVTSPSSCARGLVRAKTGSLRATVALAGLAATRTGATRTFAIVVTGRPPTLATRRLVDGLAATLTGCW